MPTSCSRQAKPALYLRTGKWFIRQLIAERRIPYIKLGNTPDYSDLL